MQDKVTITLSMQEVQFLLSALEIVPLSGNMKQLAQIIPIINSITKKLSGVAPEESENK